MASKKPLYPGQGRPWPDFLHHRHRVLQEWADEGKSPEESASIMCMDPGQVRLILMTPLPVARRGRRSERSKEAGK